MRGLILAECGFVAGAALDDVRFHNINPPPKIGVLEVPTAPAKPAPVSPPPHTGPVFPPPATH